MKTKILYVVFLILCVFFSLNYYEIRKHFYGRKTIFTPRQGVEPGYRYLTIYKAPENPKVAKAQKASGEALALLAQDKVSLVRQTVVINPQVTPKILESLAQDSDIEVRKLVALHHKTPEHVLVAMASDKQMAIKQLIALNPNTPEKTLVALVAAEDHYLKWALAKNPKTPTKILDKIFSQLREDVHILRYLASHLNTSKEVLLMLAGDEEREIRSRIVEREKISQELLQKLAQDKDAEIAAIALARNPKTSVENLEKILQSATLNTKRFLAANTSISKQIKDSLRKEKDLYVQRALTKIEKNKEK